MGTPARHAGQACEDLTLPVEYANPLLMRLTQQNCMSYTLYLSCFLFIHVKLASICFKTEHKIVCTKWPAHIIVTVTAPLPVKTWP